MKKAISTMVIAALAAGAVHAADVSVGVDFASAYVFRGAEFNDGAVMQPYMEIGGFPIPEEYGSLAIGTWANFDINDAGAGSEFTEIDYYLSYSLPVSVVDLSVGYCEYTYPGFGGDADREISFSMGKGLGESGLYPYFNAYYGVDGGIDGDSYLQAGIGYEVAASDALSLSADVAVGYLFGDEDGFNDCTSSLGASYALTERMGLSASVTYVAELDDEVLEVGTEVYGMVGVSYDF